MRRAKLHGWLWIACACAEPTAGTQAQPGRTPAAAQPRTITLSVVATNDVHGRVTQLPLLGGYVANLRAARAADGGGVLLLDAGDMFQGTLESNLGEGAAMVRAYGALRYDAAAVGNHEFDFGPSGPRATPEVPEDDPLGALRERARQAAFPLLSSNLRARGGGAFPIAQVARSALLSVAGVRVGVIGGITMEALSATHAANVRGLSLASLEDSVKAEAAALRGRGATVVIAVVHAGGTCGDFSRPAELSSCDPHSELFRLAAALRAEGVDLLIGGHVHAGVAHEVAGIPTLVSFSNGQAFGRVDLTVSLPEGRVTARELHPPHPLCAEELSQPACTAELYEGKPVARDASVLAALRDDLRRAEHEDARLVGVELPRGLRRGGDESPLSNLLADLMLRALPGADAAINNGGSVRVSLPAGPLRYGALFRAYPFDNVLATLRVPAATLARILANALQGAGHMPALAGLRARARCKGGELDVQLYRSGGLRVRPREPLRVTTSDYVAAKNDGLFAGIELTPEQVTLHDGQLVRDALEAGLARAPGHRIDETNNRLYDPKHPRIAFEGNRPLRCP